MKLHAFISICFLFALIACRSNKDMHKVSESASETETKASIQSKDSTVTTTNTRGRTSNITTEKQYIRTTWYRPDGTISAVQDSWWDSQRDELATHEIGSSSVSVAKQKADSTKKVNQKKLETEQLNAFTDSRPIQGSEWFGVIIGISVVLILVAIILYTIYRKKKK